MPATTESRLGGARTTREGAWRVDDLVIDVGRRIVSRDGHELPVSGLSFDVLIALIEAAPNLVAGDELMDRVWGGIVVSPETLTQRMKILRDAIGDDARRPRYVQGARGHGYRLLPRPVRLESAPIEPVAPSPRAAPVAPASSMDTGGETAISRSADPRGRSATRFAVVLAIGALIALAWWMLRPSTEPTDDLLSGDEGVAVLPFRNLAGTESGEALAAGMAEAVLHRLAGLDGVKVISRQSAFAAANSARSPRDIGQQLHARYLLEGSVQGSAGGLRVRTALTDVADGRQLWSLQFDRGNADLLAIQDEIAVQVARTFAQMTGESVEPVAIGAGTSSAAAQLAFLQGQALAERQVVAELDAALARFEEATRLDPGYAAAHAAAAAALLTREQLRLSQRVESPPELLARASQHVAQALAADPHDGAAHVVRARIETQRREYDAAERDFQAGLDSRPNDADAHLQYARFLFYGLDPVEHPESTAAAERVRERYRLALRHCDRAAELDPLSPEVRFVRGQMALHLGDFAGAEPHFEDALRIDPNHPPSLGRLAQLHWLNGALADAVLYGERALAIDPQAEWIRRMLSQYYVEIGDAEAAEHVLAQGGPGLVDGRLALLLSQRRWIEAGEIVLADRQRQPRSYDRDLASFGLREWARQSPADADQAMAVLQAWIVRKKIGGQLIVNYTSWFAALALADLLQSRGDVSEGRALLDEVLRAGEVNTATSADPTIVEPTRSDERAVALALALRGDTAGALDQIEALLRGRQFRHLWYDMEIQPAFAPLRRDPRFAVLLAQYRAHIRVERDALAMMRARGAAPSR